jgi:hypothetical protein
MLLLVLLAQLDGPSLPDAGPVEQYDDPDTATGSEPVQTAAPTQSFSAARLAASSAGNLISTAFAVVAMAPVVVVGAAVLLAGALSAISNTPDDFGPETALLGGLAAVSVSGYVLLAPLGAWLGHSLAGGERSYGRAVLGGLISIIAASAAIGCSAAAGARGDTMLGIAIGGAVVSTMGPVLALEL